MNAHTISNWTELSLNAGAKSIWIMALLAIGMLLFRRCAAATRHFLWLAGLLALLLLPLAAVLPQPWPGPAWTQRADFMNRWLDGFTVRATVTGVASNPDQFRSPAANPGTEAPGAQGRYPKLLGVEGGGWDLRMLIFVTWGLGLAVVALRSALRLIALHKLEHNSRAWDDPACQDILEGEKHGLGVKRNVRLLCARGAAMPMTWGWWQPVLLLPYEAGQWDWERLRLVLRHELAHVKRWDCMTQGLAHLSCALYWFNPLVWVAARQMRLERERACDDLVVNGGGQPSVYAEHLLQIARSFAFVPRVASIPMAKASGLEHRLRAIMDPRRQHGRLNPTLALLVVAAISLAALALGGFKSRGQNQGASEPELRRQQMTRLQAFSVAKQKQSQTLAAKAGEELAPAYERLFEAATNGNWQMVTNLYEYFKTHHGQYAKEGAASESLPHTSYWSPVLEVCLAYWEIVNGDPKYTQIVADDVINSIPPGSIYFGGTDPGRGLITAFSKSQIDADPFFTLTQNALADGSYLDYLRATYGGKIYTPTAEDSQNCFNEYLKDAETRLAQNKLKPGEDVKRVGDKVTVVGQVCVMSVNALIARIIFDKNPAREFYIEESFPLEWMYPHLEPHGLIMKINREPLVEISGDVLQPDHQYWTQRVGEMLGNWLTEQTSVQTVADFVEKVYVRHDLNGFGGDPRFINNDVPQRIFSKLRSSVGGVYAWRREHTSNDSEKSRLTPETDFAFKQAWALCPYSPEAVFRYANFLIAEKRSSDALLVAETAARVSPAADRTHYRDLVERLKSNSREIPK